jgi:hypothetical protein
MATIQLAPPYPVFTDKNGDPLDNGYLYFGVVDLNPETNPIQVYYDSAFTQPVAQPIRTSNGYPMRNGAPALIYAGSQFSVTVRDKNSDLVIYSPVGYGVDPGSIAGVVVVQDQTGDGVTTALRHGRITIVRKRDECLILMACTKTNYLQHKRQHSDVLRGSAALFRH